MSTGKRIEQALSELAAAHVALNDAGRTLAQARSDEVNCLNRVNSAQKEVDELMAAVKSEAHRDTDWGRARATGSRLPA
jgi:hypothetical protein